MLVKSTSLMHDDDDGNRGHVMAYILYTTWHNPSVHVWNHQCSSCIEKTLIQTIPLLAPVALSWMSADKPDSPVELCDGIAIRT